MSHPYVALNDHHFWYKSMTAPAPGHIDPMIRQITIAPTDKVATMGSCFAQHLSGYIAKSGFNYYVPEQPPGEIDAETAKKRNYGIFSARYGNVYTVKQAVQLFDRAFGCSTLQENVWLKDHVFVDAFRPQIEPEGFPSKQALLEDREKHLSCVKHVFEHSDWLIFTLGLTEAWRSKDDGAVFPMAPGVSGGFYNKDNHEFVNYSVSEVIQDLSELVNKVTAINPGIDILLTVSPVPLIATYEDRHVLVSTTVSKAILRVAADEIEKRFKNVLYFPSYEIITSAANSGRYFQDDLRQVTDIGVNHVMRIFSKHLLQANSPSSADGELAVFSGETRGSEDIVCDEEVIERAIRGAGFL